MTIYVDSSALVERVSKEEHQRAPTAELTRAVAEGHLLISSVLARVEVSRALPVRIDDLDVTRVTAASAQAMEGIGVAPMTGPILESARIIGPRVLRSLDAIHLATAIVIGADELWTYDERLATASEEVGITVRMPT